MWNQHTYADGIVECQKKFNSQGRHPQGIRKSIHWYNCLPTRIIPISELQRKEGGCWLTGELACFPVHKWRFYKTDPDAILLSQSSYFCWFAMSRQILLLRVNYYPWRIPLQESVNKRKSNFSSLSVYVHLWGSVRLWECINTEFDWEAKRKV